MGNLFGVRRRAPAVTAQDKAILQLKQQRDKIKIYQKKVDKDLTESKELALKLFQNGMKDRALVVLRRRKFMSDILTRTDRQLETLEQLVSDIEFSQIEVSVVEGLKVGTDALKQLNSLMNIDDIHQMMEDNKEAADKQKEISDILLGSSERYDDSELYKELESYVVTQPTSDHDIYGKDKEEPTIVTEPSVELDLVELPIKEEQPPIIAELRDLPVAPTDVPEKSDGPKEERREKVRPLELAQ